MDEQQAKEMGIIREMPKNPKVFKAMAEVGKKLKAVSMTNMQRYKARHIYDVYNMLQPILAEQGLVISRELISNQIREVKSQKGTLGTHREQMWKFTFTAEDGSWHSTTFPAESIDWGDKSSSQCDAMAFKQMLIHTFLIPTEDMKDPDDKEQMTTTVKAPPQSKKTNEDLSKKKVTPAQLSRLHAIMNQTDWTKEDVSKYAEKIFKIKSSKELNVKQYNELIDTIMNTEPERE